jgi:antirestriction protein
MEKKSGKKTFKVFGDTLAKPMWLVKVIHNGIELVFAFPNKKEAYDFADVVKHTADEVYTATRAVYRDGGKVGSGTYNPDTPKVYVADIAAYNEGKLIGEWVDLSKFDSGEEVMQEIDRIIKKWSKTQGEFREEYSIHDYENFPREMYSEWMGEQSFDQVIQAYKIAEEKDMPIEVIGRVISEYEPDNIEEWIEERYEGQFNSDTDLAYHNVEMMGGISNLGTNTLEMYFDYEAYGRDLAFDYTDMDGYYFRSYAKGGAVDKDLSKYMCEKGKYAKGGRIKKNKGDYEKYLNELGTPRTDHPDHGGRVSRSMVNKYGTWLRKNDPTAFDVGYNEYVYSN